MTDQSGMTDPVIVNRNRRWIYVVVGVAIMLMFGMIYAWSVFVLPLEKEFGWSREQTSLTFSITMTFFAAGIVVGGILTDRNGPRWVSFGAGTFIGGGLVAASFTTSLLQLYLSYGVVCGLSVGIAYNCVISTVIRWFPDRRGAVSGLLMMGFGFGGLVLGFGAGRLIETIGWRTAFQVLGGAAFFTIVVLGQFLRRHQPPQADVSSRVPGELRPLHATDDAWHQVLALPLFWMLWLWQISVISGGLATIAHIIPLASEKGFPNDQAALALGLLSVFNGIGRVSFGVLSDKLGRRITMLADSILMVIAMVALTSDFSQSSYPGLLFSVIAAGLAYGGAMPQTSAAIATFFGSKHFGTNFGLVSTGIVAASLLGPYMSGVAKTIAGNYSLAFLALACVAGVGLIIALRIDSPETATRQHGNPPS